MAWSEQGYRYEATSIHGVLQQLAACYLRDEYYYYVVGEIRDGKDPHDVDEAILSRYGVRISKYTRVRRKKLRFANVHYLRYLRWYLILATEGEHLFFKREVGIKDVRRLPIKFEGHSVSYRNGHSSVRIEDGIYRDLKAYFGDIATNRSEEAIGRELRGLPFIRFAPVRSQVYWLWKDVNARREAAGLPLVPGSFVEGGRKVCRPFEPVQSADEALERTVILSASSAR